MAEVRNALVIARREFAERAKSRWFIAITLLGPIGMAAMAIIPALLIGNPAGTRIEIIDHTGVLAEPIRAALADRFHWKPTTVARDTPEATEMARVRDRQINGFLVIPAGAIDGDAAIEYRGDNGSNQIVQGTLHEIVRSAVQAERGKRAGIDKDKLDKIIKQVQVDAQQTNGKTEAASGDALFGLGFAIAYVLLFVIMGYAVVVMRSVVQEKTSRVMELMVATVKPRALMAGKILGVGGVGLFQVAVWLGIGAMTLAYRDQLLGAFGIAAPKVMLPPLTLDVIAIALAYFVLGYFFYASMYAAVGAMVSTEQDTQQVQVPITLLLIIGLVSITAVSGNPRGTAATIMTLLPFWSPLLMPMRYVLGGATPLDVVISLAVLVLSTALIARAAAKIYRTGVLMYGKRPTFQELLRWLRY